MQLVLPHDYQWGKKVEPEGVGIWRTAIRSHVACGVIGLVAGLLIFACLYALGWTSVRTTPGMSLVAMAFFPTLLGLMVGGLLTVRPDHDAVIAPVREAAADGRWSVVVHPVTRRQRAAAIHMLTQTGAHVFSTL